MQEENINIRKQLIKLENIISERFFKITIRVCSIRIHTCLITYLAYLIPKNKNFTSENNMDMYYLNLGLANIVLCLFFDVVGSIA